MKHVWVGLVAFCVAIVVAPTQASMIYTFNIQSANSSYESSITIGAQAGVSSWSISSVASEGVLSFGGQPQSWSGNSSGMFSWDAVTRQLHVEYSVAGSAFSMTLPNAHFPQGTDADGLPLGTMVGGNGTTTNPPNLTVDGESYIWTTSAVQYFKQDSLTGNPIPGEGAIFALIGFGLARQRRIRTS
ncbi:MAG: hypothetical protein MK085_08835 [Phycisphaerales bacterium]|nr:hypothetical protein [Phycisphaerales bacterium]